MPIDPTIEREEYRYVNPVLTKILPNSFNTAQWTLPPVLNYFLKNIIILALVPLVVRPPPYET